MRRSPSPRALGAVGIAAITATALTGCIPGPPPVPQATSIAPAGLEGAASGEVRDGWLSRDAMVSVPVVIEERSAVVIGATSLDEQDLMLRLVGGGVDIENDDAHREPRTFAFDQQSRDPALAAVLEPGTYALEVREWAGEATEFQLQMLTGSRSLTIGEAADLPLEPGFPTLVVLPAGAAAITATADVDTVLWAYSAADEMWITDDDSAGDRNPSIDFGATIGDAIPALVIGYERDAGGGVQVMVE